MQGNGADERWYTIPYHYNQITIPHPWYVLLYTRKISKRAKKKGEEKKMDEKETKQTSAQGAEADSRGNKVDVCWYDQPYDLPS